MTKDLLVPLLEKMLERTGGTDLGNCRKCNTLLCANNVAYWLGLDICRNCVGDSLGDCTNKAIELLLNRGYLVTVPQQGAWYLRAEVRTKDRMGVEALRIGLGGKVHRHNEYTWRWIVYSNREMHTVGRALMDRCPKLGVVVLRVCSKKGKDKHEYIQAFALAVGRRSVAIRNYVSS